MPSGQRRTSCGVCKRPIEEVGRLSARGKCAECGDRRMMTNLWQLRIHSGPFHEHWQRRIVYGALASKPEA